MVQGHGVNDMHRGWIKENEWNKRVYRKWQKMLYRCYNEDYHKTHPTYKDCTVCDRWLTLSKFVEDFEFIDGYDRERFLNGELVLDKDIKSRKRGEKNKQYIMIECLLTTIEENSKEATRTRDNSYLQGREFSEETRQKISEAHKGKLFSEEHKQKMSENSAKTMKGKFGSEHNCSKKVAQYDKQTSELIKIWDSLSDVTRELGIDTGSISKCCKGKQKSAGGYIWRYVEDE